GHASGAGTMPFMLPETNPDAKLFEGEYQERFDKILTRYPDKQAALLPTLALTQELRGYVSAASMDRVAELLGLSPAYVRGVTTFYTMYNK
ncbi:MAG TPA: NADH-quinone oxidoreductase subunit E, partial [Gemmatimonadetes bacterium]|nr:NADH-quinone oxidoreductase subunit E [Gemmatimonadota bacterium]